MTDAPAGLQNSAAVGVDYAPPDVEVVTPTETATAGFDPGEHTVAEVESYLAKHPDESDAVLAAEAAGKNRVSLVGD